MTKQISINIDSIPKDLNWIFRLKPELQAELTGFSKIVRIPANSTVVSSGSDMKFLIGIIEGALTINNASKFKSSIHRGGTVGWLSAIDNKPIDVDVISETDSELLLIPISTAKNILFNSREVLEKVMSELACNLRQLAAEKNTLLAPTAHQRVYVHILNIVSNASDKIDNIKLPKQDEIAQTVNTSRETVSRALQHLIKQGIIDKQGHNLRVRDIQGLSKLAT